MLATTHASRLTMRLALLAANRRLALGCESVRRKASRPSEPPDLRRPRNAQAASRKNAARCANLSSADFRPYAGIADATCMLGAAIRE